jgi:Uncharacterised methyltransferase family (DUF6094)
MRLAGQAKAGYFPCPPDAVAVALKRIRLVDPTAPLLDPCAGQGAAIKQIADGLRAASNATHVIELDEGRAAILRQTLPDAKVLAPASFMGCKATSQSFSFGWVNPPFDSETGAGHRCEYSFLVRATGWLRPGGVLALVVPEHVAQSNDIRRQLLTWYDTISERAFPDHCRQYDEVIILAVKRSKAVNAGADREHLAWEPVAPDTIYDIPPGDQPKVWEKIEYTPAELLRALGRSPLRRHLLPPAELPLPSPPLALGTGHIALLLAAGHLDGVVRPEDGPCHVVRGTASKVKYLAHEEARENADGSVTTKEVWSERINLTVRAVDGTGVIRTFTQE